MPQQVGSRRSFIHRQPEAQVQETSQHVRRSVRQSVIRRVFCCDLEDGRHTFVLVPWRMPGNHLHHRATKTPAEATETQPGHSTTHCNTNTSHYLSLCDRHYSAMFKKMHGCYWLSSVGCYILYSSHQPMPLKDSAGNITVIQRRYQLLG